MKFRVVCRKLYDYVRYDLKEIAFPSSLPDPPHIKKRPKLSWHDCWCILKEVTRLYGASWVRDISPDLRPNNYKKVAEDEAAFSSDAGSGGDKEKGRKGSSEPSVLEDLAIAARGGAETLKPATEADLHDPGVDVHDRDEEFRGDVPRGAQGSAAGEGW